MQVLLWQACVQGGREASEAPISMPAVISELS